MHVHVHIYNNSKISETSSFVPAPLFLDLLNIFLLNCTQICIIFTLYGVLYNNWLLFVGQFTSLYNSHVCYYSTDCSWPLVYKTLSCFLFLHLLHRTHYMLQKSNVFYIFIRLSALRLQMANVSLRCISFVINHFNEEDFLLAPICRHKFINCFKIPAWNNIYRYKSSFLEWKKWWNYLNEAK